MKIEGVDTGYRCVIHAGEERVWEIECCAVCVVEEEKENGIVVSPERNVWRRYIFNPVHICEVTDSVHSEYGEYTEITLQFGDMCLARNINVPYTLMRTIYRAIIGDNVEMIDPSFPLHVERVSPSFPL